MKNIEKRNIKMDSNLLKYLAFVETVDKGSFTKAADSLNYAQSDPGVVFKSFSASQQSMRSI